MISTLEFETITLLEKKKKKKKDEAAPDSMGAPLYKGKKTESRRIWEASTATLATDSAKPLLEGGIVKVVLLTEGLGNMHDMNYYGPEAVNSMPAAFEGAPCMLNHLSYSQENDRPEGEVEKTVGYYKNLRVENLNGKLGCVGELHFDITQEGWNAYQKAKTAIHYASEFRMSEREYVGLSVNAGGDSELRMMDIDGEQVEVNYVLRFTEARSCDMVTLPARGGKFVDLVESMAGSNKNKEEVRMKIVKRLEAAQAALKLAESENDPDLRKKKISEAQKEVGSLLKDIAEAASRKAKEGCAGKGEDEDEDEDESEDESESESKDEDEDASSDGSDDGDGDGDDNNGDSHTVVTHKVVKKTGKAALAQGGDKESKRYAVRALIAESGMDKENFDIAELAAMPFEEAKREIARTRRISESLCKKILKATGQEVSAGNSVKAHESGQGASKADLSAEFADLSVL